MVETINPNEMYVYHGADDRFFAPSGLASGAFLQKMLEKSPRTEYITQKELNEKLGKK